MWAAGQVVLDDVVMAASASRLVYKQRYRSFLTSNRTPGHSLRRAGLKPKTNATFRFMRDTFDPVPDPVSVQLPPPESTSPSITPSPVVRPWGNPLFTSLLFIFLVSFPSFRRGPIFTRPRLFRVTCPPPPRRHHGDQSRAEEGESTRLPVSSPLGSSIGHPATHPSAHLRSGR